VDTPSIGAPLFFTKKRQGCRGNAIPRPRRSELGPYDFDSSPAIENGLGEADTGPGAASRRAVGTPVFYGMLAAAVIGIFVIPMLYVVFQWMRERTGWKPVLVKPAAPVESLQTQSPAE
jgi:hypothetical protein